MLPKGTKIVKCSSNSGDPHQDGAPGTVMGGIDIPEDKAKEISEASRKAGVVLPEGYIVRAIYAIEWEDLPGLPVHTIDYRIKPVEDGNKE